MGATRAPDPLTTVTMERTNAPAIFFCALLAGCSSLGRLTEAELAKIDPPIQRMLSGERVAELEETSRLRPDGSREYPVIVRTVNPQEIEEMGITIESRFGEILTVRATGDEIKKLARRPSVTGIRLGSRNEPNTTID